MSTAQTSTRNGVDEPETRAPEGDPDGHEAPSSDAEVAARADEAPADEAPAHKPAARGRLFTWMQRWGFATAVLLFCAAIVVRTHLWFIFPYAVPVSNDEGYLAAASLRMSHGHWLPYVDVVSQRGPFLYWITALFMNVLDPWSWVSMRLLGMGLALAEVGLTFALAATLFSPLAASFAAFVITYFLTYELNPWDGIGVNGEPLAVCFALVAAILVARVQLGKTPEKSRTRAFVLAGVAMGCAGLSKQMFLSHIVPLLAWIAIGRDEQDSLKQRAWAAAKVLMGVAIPFSLVASIFIARGHLEEFIYYYQRYGRDIFMDPVTLEVARDKVREQIDKYFLGFLMFSGCWLVTVAHGLRLALTPSPSPEEASTEAGAGATRGEPRGEMAPELQVTLNAVVPGLGWLLSRRRALLGAGVSLGSLAAFIAWCVWVLSGVKNNVSMMFRVITAWCVACTVSAIAMRFDLYFARPDARWRALPRLRDDMPRWFSVLHALFGFVGACFTFRFFPHYFIQFFPFAAVFVGALVASNWADRRAAGDTRPPVPQWARYAPLSVLALGIMGLMLVANSALERNVNLRREIDRWYQNPALDPVVKYVSDKTTPDQTIFVWGFRAEVFLSAHRLPASRFVYSVYPAGVVPWFSASHDEEERRIAHPSPDGKRDSRDELLEDLEREKPELVVDAGRSMSGRYMYNYPKLRAYLDEHYCFMRYVDGEPIYRRKRGGRCPPADM